MLDEFLPITPDWLGAVGLTLRRGSILEVKGRGKTPSALVPKLQGNIHLLPFLQGHDGIMGGFDLCHVFHGVDVVVFDVCAFDLTWNGTFQTPIPSGPRRFRGGDGLMGRVRSPEELGVGEGMGQGLRHGHETRIADQVGGGA